MEAAIPDPAQTETETETETETDYLAFGLRFRSDLALPELTAAAPDGTEPDVRIGLGSVGARLPDAVDLPPRMQAGRDVFQLDADAGRFRVTGGRRITVDPAPLASARDVRLFLLGSAMGALCHQRARLALHAAVLEIDGLAIAVAGPSGAGKSTLAALHRMAGGGVLTDDLCAVTLNGNESPTAHRGLRRIKLWPDSADLVGWRPDDSARIADQIDKFSLPILRGAPSLPLARLYILRPGDSTVPDVRRLSGPEAAMAVVAQVYRWPVAVAMGKAADLFDQCVGLARRCEIFELRFAHDILTPRRLLTAVIQQAGGGVST